MDLHDAFALSAIRKADVRGDGNGDEWVRRRQEWLRHPNLSWAVDIAGKEPSHVLQHIDD